MKLSERSFYSDKGLRPRPFIHFNETEDIIIVITNWAQKIDPKKVIAVVENYLLSSKVDDEVTSPFISLPQLGKSANHLRTSLLLLNDMIYKDYNKQELNCGLEIFVGLRNRGEFVFGHVGQPNILISRGDKNILPLYQNLDLSLDLSQDHKLAPVPSKLIGINAQIDIEIQSFKPQDGDKLVLLSCSWIPQELLVLKPNKRSFENFSKILSEDSEQSSWLGLIEF
jgi:hypothetical protein